MPTPPHPPSLAPYVPLPAPPPPPMQPLSPPPPVLPSASPCAWESMTLLASAAAGDTVLEVGYISCGVSIGSTLHLGSGDRSEVVTVKGFGSILLEEPLAFDHPAGESIQLLATPPTSPLPPPTPSPPRTTPSPPTASPAALDNEPTASTQGLLSTSEGQSINVGVGIAVGLLGACGLCVLVFLLFRRVRRQKRSLSSLQRASFGDSKAIGSRVALRASRVENVVALRQGHHGSFSETI